jgi:hypothetical protein
LLLLRRKPTRTAAVQAMRLANEAAALVGLKVVRSNLLSEEWFKKVAYFARLLDRVSDVDGDLAVCRVGVGKTLAVVASLLRSSGQKREVWGFDSWASSPQRNGRERPLQAPVPTPATLAEVRLRLQQMGFDRLDGIRLIDGELPLTLERAPEQLAFVDLDLLALDEYVTCLESLWPQVRPGGIVSLGSFAAEGARRRFLAQIAPGSARVETDAAWHGRAFVVKSR